MEYLYAVEEGREGEWLYNVIISRCHYIKNKGA